MARSRAGIKQDKVEAVNINTFRDLFEVLWNGRREEILTIRFIRSSLSKSLPRLFRHR